MYNQSKTLLYVNRKFDTEIWANVKVGDIIKIMKNEVVPSDVLIIQSSAENGFAYLETTNLDGENSLKPREAIIVTNGMDIDKIKGEIEVDHPNNDIYGIDGTLFLQEFEKIFFSINNTLLRGGKLKNVEYVVGIVLYSGKDTKLMQNIR
jgi:magnesium-transporting ATPase (P-type)